MRRPLHIDATLAHRIERAEGRLLEEAVTLHQQSGGSEAFARLVGGGVAVGFDAGSPVNKAIGVGLDEVSREAWQEVEQAFLRLGVPTIVELCPLASESFVAHLSQYRYQLASFESALVRDLGSDVAEPLTDTRVAVRDVQPDELDLWAAVVAEGFGAEPASPLAQTLGSVLGATARTRCLLAEHDGALAGGAAVRIEDGVALSFATSTRPEHRRKGVQQALVAASAFAAQMAEADLIIATTQPGSQSQRTFERLGFRVAYSRAILRSWWPTDAEEQ